MTDGLRDSFLPPVLEYESEGLSLETAIAKLDRSNAAFEDLLVMFELIGRQKFNPARSKFCFYKKDKNLPELFQFLESTRHSPLVDKRLRMVICPMAHELLKAVLYCYHNNIKFEREKQDEYADLYIKTGLGWYRSTTGSLVCSSNYKSTREERDLFMILGVTKFEE